jgi:hypothetical protein
MVTISFWHIPSYLDFASPKFFELLAASYIFCVDLLRDDYNLLVRVVIRFDLQNSGIKLVKATGRGYPGFELGS